MEQRLKESGEESVQTSVWTAHFLHDGTTADYTNSGDSMDYYRHVGYSLDNFLARKKRGELLPITSWLQVQITGEATGAYEIWKDSLHIRSSGNSQQIENVVPDQTILWSKDEDMSIDALSSYEVQKAAASIYSSGWDVLTFAVEFKQTIRMFEGFLSRLISYLKDPSNWSGAWLEVRYGWRTLMFDLMDINNLLTEFDFKLERYNQRCGNTYSVSEPRSFSKTLGSQIRTMHVTDTWTFNVNGHVVADIKPPALIVNPILTAWEKIPLSFVIDWVIQIGQWIQQLSFLSLQSNYVASFGYHTTFRREMSSYENENINGWAGWSTGSVTATGSFTRRVPTSVSNLPTVHLNIDVYKIVDLVALVLQALKRR